MPNTSRTTAKPLAWFSLLLAAIMVVMLLMGYRAGVGPFAVGSLATLALFCMRHPVLKSYAFTVWVFAFVAASMFYPVAFMTWGGYDLKGLVVPLMQIIMFGMASALAINVLKTPQAALASAIFGPWQNISGSILATYWHRKPVEETRPVEAARGIAEKGELNEPA